MLKCRVKILANQSWEIHCVKSVQIRSFCFIFSFNLWGRIWSYEKYEDIEVWWKLWKLICKQKFISTDSGGQNIWKNFKSQTKLNIYRKLWYLILVTFERSCLSVSKSVKLNTKVRFTYCESNLYWSWVNCKNIVKNFRRKNLFLVGNVDNFTTWHYTKNEVFH